MTYYVYILQSEKDSDRYYVGLTNDLNRRLEEHSSGESLYTNKYKPWRLSCSLIFTTYEKAEKFELYLKSGSGRTFIKRHF